MPPRWERRAVAAVVRTLFHRGRPGRAWPLPATLPHRPVEIGSLDGARLSALWFPHERPRGAVVLVHPDRRYGKFWFVREGWVDLLQAAGYEALAFDFPGYGGSRGAPTYHHEHVVAAARFARDWAGGLPVHVVGLSVGAFAACNAAPRLPFVESMVLESPYPSFNAWYGQGPGRWAMDFFDGVFPRTAAAIQADRNLARSSARRILVALAEDDEVTPPALSEAVHRAAPEGRRQLVRVPGARHLEAFGRSEAYREAVLRTLDGAASARPG